ncbi:hypothetical protein LZL87_013784 [Fusarium oxysporum]|nr:hypothetical protein LZL87_013784 [Fusarium oxysporum]
MPACNNCIKARWTCPGVLSEADIRFRHHSGVTFKNSQANLSSKQSELSNPGSGRMTRHVSPPLQDRATAFFFSRFVLNTNGDPQTKRGVCEFLPELLQQKKAEGVLGTIIPATGLATLVNAGKSLEWKSEAFALCGKALRQLTVDLGDAIKARSDHTLAAIMLMGTFELGSTHTERRGYAVKSVLGDQRAGPSTRTNTSDQPMPQSPVSTPRFKRIGVHTKKAAHVEAPPSPGGCLLLWPLFFSDRPRYGHTTSYLDGGGIGAEGFILF